jgi:hypothetical protein
MHVRPVLKGLATYLPTFHRPRGATTGGEVSPRYCYTVWLRHLVMAHESGLPTSPETVAELGPGDSLGLGLAALLTGATRYRAFDIVAHTNVERNLHLLHDLVALLEARTPIPDAREFPEVVPQLGDAPDAYAFPSAVLDEARLERALAPPRVAAIRQALQRLGERVDGGIEMSYVAYRYNAHVLAERSVDMLVSQAVMEHVDDPAGTYASLARWLRPDGFASHVIDFRSHGTAPTWDGHWTYSDTTWRLVRGRRKFVISNRLPLSMHHRLLEEAGFDIVRTVRTTQPAAVARPELAPRFVALTEEDRTTDRAFIQTRLRPSAADAADGTRH